MEQVDLPGLESISDYHDFWTSLECANVSAKVFQLHQFYQATFTNIQRIIEVSGKTADGLALQKQGIDTIIELTNGKQVCFDEKWRKKDWGDILIEEFSRWNMYPYLCSNEKISDMVSGNKARNCQFVPYPVARRYGITPGWVRGAKMTDYVTYIFKPSRRVYFLPFLLLQRAWGKYHKDWLGRFGRVLAQNRTYTTTNIPILNEVLFEALYEVAALPNDKKQAGMFTRMFTESAEKNAQIPML